MTRPRRWTLGPRDETEDLEQLLERLVDLSLLDAQALLERDPALRVVLVEDFDNALEAADTAVRLLMSRAGALSSDAGARRQRAAWLALAGRVERCAVPVQVRRESLG